MTVTGLESRAKKPVETARPASVPAAAGPARGRRKSAPERRREIVQAALRLAVEIGPDRVSTQQLADAVGVSQPAIFRHFPNRAAIWLAVGNHLTGAMRAERDAVARVPPDRRLRESISRQLGFIARTPAIPAILFSRELHATNEPLRRHMMAMMAERRAGFSAMIAREQAQGRLQRALAADDAAALILATIQGLAMRWSLERQGFDFRAEGERLIFGLLDSWKGARG